MEAASGGPATGERRLEVGRICNGYVVEALIAESEGAVVYAVKHVKRGSRHALKVLRRVDSRRKLRIEQEAIFREELAHPNIAPAFDSVEVDGQPGLVMDYVDGPSLARWMSEEAPDDLGERLALFRGIVEGCRHAHSRGVMHRDLKPSNVLLTRSGGSPGARSSGGRKRASRWAASVSNVDRPENGAMPHTSSYRMQPSEYRSARSSTLVASRTCSGAA